MRHERAIPISAEFEIRSTDKGHRFTGYAAIFGSTSAPLPYIETVAPGAFARSLTSPPNGRQTFVVDHDDGKLLASTKTERLHLGEDSRGLLVDSEWPDTSYARDVRELSDMGELGGMSFEFSATKGGAPFTADGKRRTVREAKLYHVTVLTGKTPAYAETTAAFRALANQTGADFDDVSLLFEAVHEGRKLDDTEWSLLERIVRQVAPADSRWSSAASDASSATYALSSLLSLLGDETDDATQAGYLKTAIDALQLFIGAEATEIGTDADKAASGTYRAAPNLEAARALLGAS